MLNFLVHQNITEDYHPKKMENKKTRAKDHYRADKGKLQKGRDFEFF